MGGQITLKRFTELGAAFVYGGSLYVLVNDTDFITDIFRGRGSVEGAVFLCFCDYVMPGQLAEADSYEGILIHKQPQNERFFVEKIEA